MKRPIKQGEVVYLDGLKVVLGVVNEVEFYVASLDEEGKLMTNTDGSLMVAIVMAETGLNRTSMMYHGRLTAKIPRDGFYYFETFQKLKDFKMSGHKTKLGLEHFRNSNRLYVTFVTNSNGVHQNRCFPDKEESYLIDQYWVDMSKYKKGFDETVDFWVENVLPILNV